MTLIRIKQQYVTSAMRAIVLTLSLATAALPALALLAPQTALAASARPENSAELVAGSILSNIGHGTWIVEGRSPHVIYIFFDPNCPYCHQLYEDLRPWVKRNRVQLRWLPVGVLTATSRGKAAAILGAKNRLAAFRLNERGFSRAAGFGRIPEEPLPKPAILKDLRANEALLQRTGQESVPAMVFRLRDGTPIVVQGAPPPRVLKTIVDQLQ